MRGQCHPPAALQEGARLRTLSPAHFPLPSTHPLCPCALLPPPPPRYDVFLFSKPDTLLALVSLPVVKLMQLRYVNDSAKAVAAAVVP